MEWQPKPGHAGTMLIVVQTELNQSGNEFLTNQRVSRYLWM